MSAVRSLFWSTAVACLAAALGPCASGCGAATGGAEAGNPSLVVGTVPESSDGCAADQVAAADSRGQVFEASVAQDCSFALTLPSSEAYHIDLVSGGEAVASLAFNNSPGRFVAPAMNLAPTDETVFLDAVDVEDGVGTPSREPATQIDQDGDGLPDFADQDDDGDGVTDGDEADCDLDGVIDDFDHDPCLPDPNPTISSAILEVSPRNGEGLGPVGLKAKTTEEIRLRFSCPVDPATLLVSSLLVFPEDDPGDSALCVFDVLGSGRQVRCVHAGLRANTVYRARLEDVRCEDGAEVPPVTWTWRTQASP